MLKVQKLMWSNKSISLVPPLHIVRLQHDCPHDCPEAIILVSNTAIRFMSNLYLAVEKVTESLVGTTNVNLSLVLEASDKRREWVARSVGPLLTYLAMSNGNYDLCCLSPAGVFFLPRSKRLFVLVFLKKKRPNQCVPEWASQTQQNQGEVLLIGRR